MYSVDMIATKSKQASEQQELQCFTIRIGERESIVEFPLREQPWLSSCTCSTGYIRDGMDFQHFVSFEGRSHAYVQYIFLLVPHW